MKKKQPEAALQAASAQFLDLRLPKNYISVHVPNGAQLAKPWHAKRLKAQGMRPGCPDWFIFGGGKAWAIELKAPSKYATKEQKAFHGRLEAAGVKVYVCWSLEGIESVLRTIGIVT